MQHQRQKYEQRGKVFFLCIFLSLFICTFSILAIAEDDLLSNHDNQIYHLKLLAVQGEEGRYIGSDAELYLELKEGTGRVFLDTYPLTKMDTQVSTRFAKEIACKHFKLNCEKYDFIYTIKAQSATIGGPSAGAAIAALTTLALLDLEPDEKVTITGTINSGGLIGPVGGVKEKLEAASKAGLKKVLLAKGSSKQRLPEIQIPEDSEETIIPVNITTTTTESTTNQTDNTDQDSFDLIEYGKENLSLEVLEVTDLDEVIFQLTGVQLNHKPVKIEENKEYTEIMRGLEQLLCSRATEITKRIKEAGLILQKNTSEEAQQKQKKAEEAAQAGDYYSAASFCFSNNVLLKTEYYWQKHLSREAFFSLFDNLATKTTVLENKLKTEKIETISDLQALMIVKERLDEVKEKINEYQEKKALPLNSLAENYFPSLLAYAEERYFTALSWMQFFSMDGKKYGMDLEKLKDSCLQKISEAEERQQYASIFLGGLSLEEIQGKINLANRASSEGEFAFCLIEAAQAKADADAILSSLGLSGENFNDYLESKSKVVERVIAENSMEGAFPILGYSYYRYANTLKGQDNFAAMIYFEYALELSDLGIYFPEEQAFFEKASTKFQISNHWSYLLEGFAFGIALTAGGFVLFLCKRSKKHRKFRIRKIRKDKV